jgi:thiamine biosynthesis protein ThiS
MEASERMTDTAVVAEITVRVNGDDRAVPAGLSVAGLLEHLGLKPRMVVVEHNGEILRRDALADAAVRAGDQLELVHFVGGG